MPAVKRQKNILLALGWYDHRLLQGISAYAARHHWHLAASSITHEHVIPVGWKGDGVLTWLAAGDDLAKFVVSLKKPTVDMSLRRAHLKFPRVIQDHAKSGQLVADHFLPRGFQSFAYYSHTDNWSYEGRGMGFEKALRTAGRICTWLRWHEARENSRGPGEWTGRRNWLAKHLRQMPKPVAVFAANGSLATEVCEICEQISLAVPTEVSVVGIADYLLSVPGAHHEISTVDTNLEDQGYQAAALLDRLMNGEKPPAEPILIAPARVIVRKSSDLMAVAHSRVSKGLQFIAEKFVEEISVEDVARVAGMSRRGLHQAFLDHVGRTPGDQIRVARIECAKKYLVETNEKIESVARLSGYPNTNTFFIAFRKAMKQTPAEFRNAARRGQGPGN
jgi:LacI family transcriptional regulator